MRFLGCLVDACSLPQLSITPGVHRASIGLGTCVYIHTPEYKSEKRDAFFSREVWLEGRSTAATAHSRPHKVHFKTDTAAPTKVEFASSRAVQWCVSGAVVRQQSYCSLDTHMYVVSSHLQGTAPGEMDLRNLPQKNYAARKEKRGGENRRFVPPVGSLTSGMALCHAHPVKDTCSACE